MLGQFLRRFVAPAVVVSVGLGVRPAIAEDPRQRSSDQEEIRQLREEAESTRKKTEELQRRIDRLEARDEERERALEQRIEAAPRRYLERYLGENRFVLTGWGAGTYEWERNANSNTFTAVFVPIFLYRVTDWVLFEAEPEFELASDGDTEVNLEYAQADIFVNDYVTAVGGKFLLPFGDFIQQLHPAWINKLASFPLPFREEGGLLPFSDVGFQLRGGAQILDREGVALDYTLFVSNGPRFASDEVGSDFESNNVDPNRGKGFGARLAAYPLPLAMEMGRLKLGASTYDGKWDEDNDLWFTSWGIDAAYQLDELELRGEYLETWRDMPEGVRTDRREGWYVQGAYKLSRVPVPHLNRLELIVRYSGLNQRGPEDADGEAASAEGEEGEEDALVTKPRQVALGLDYWLTPSVVAKLEYDRELPRNAKNDHAIRAQIGVGF